MRVVTITENEGSVMLQVSGVKSNDETIYLIELAKQAILNGVLQKAKKKSK